MSQEDELRILQGRYQTAYGAYERHLAAVILAGDASGAAQASLLEQEIKTLDDLAEAREAYRNALLAFIAERASLVPTCSVRPAQTGSGED